MNYRRLIFKRIWVLVIFLLFSREGFAAGAPGGLSDKNIPNVIIIVLSGVRNSESILDPTHQYIPNLWNNMLKEGVLYTDLVSRDQEFHMPALNAINTGKNQFIFCRINTPSIFQYVRKKYGLPLSKLWLIREYCDSRSYYGTDGYMNDTYPSELPLNLVTTPELQSLYTKQESFYTNSFTELQKNFSGFAADIWDSIDEIFYRFLKKIIREFEPKMIEFVMGGVETAHYDTFARYALSLKRSDEMIFELWRMIKTNPFYKDNTYLIVCPDHERNLYYMQHDENSHDNSSHVWMYIYGPHVKKGVTINRPIYHSDIFATLAYIMDVETHPNKGKALKDCFLHPKIQ